MCPPRDDDDDKVGYGHPPTHTRFKKGQSGNPPGRPKGRMNGLTLLQQILDERITVNVNGERNTDSRRKFLMKQWVHAAMAGNVPSRGQLLPFIEQVDAMSNATPEASADTDAALLATLAERLKLAIGEEGGSNDA